nr:hypothetical protein [uncultured Lichenicoccus sp.]
MADPRGWCPDLFTPMQSGDGWLIRVKPSLARITVSQALTLSHVAGTFGNGLIELTRRGNLQLRGLTPDTSERAAPQLLAAGLGDPDPARERRRNLIVSPLMPPSGVALAGPLAAAIASAAWLDDLPPKFGFGLSAGAFPLADDQADLLVRAQGDGWRLSLGGNARQARGSAVVGPALSMARERPATRRLHAVATQAPRIVGWHPGSAAFCFGLPFGQLDAGTLARVAALAERHGDGLLHLTPWRAMLIAGIDTAAIPVLRDALHGLVLEPDDPRLLVSACIGSVGCGSGRVDARADALAILRLGVRAASIHVSGCAKGCAHPGPAALTLVGEAMREGRGRYALVRDGRAGDTALADGLDCVQIAREIGRSADPS